MDQIKKEIENKEAASQNVSNKQVSSSTPSKISSNVNEIQVNDVISISTLKFINSIKNMNYIEISSLISTSCYQSSFN